MKKIAIIYTGETRTIETTIQTFKENILLNENYHVFAVLQTSNNLLTEQLVRNNMGNNLKSYEIFNKDDFCWNVTQDNLLNIIKPTQLWY